MSLRSPKKQVPRRGQVCERLVGGHASQDGGAGQEVAGVGQEVAGRGRKWQGRLSACHAGLAPVKGRKGGRKAGGGTPKRGGSTVPSTFCSGACGGRSSSHRCPLGRVPCPAQVVPIPTPPPDLLMGWE